MLHAILILLCCQLAGEVLARGLGVPLPGPVIGMALLFAALQLRAHLKPQALDIGTLPIGSVATFLIANLSLLFVPAGTGIIRQTAVLTAHGPGLIIALIGSTLLTLIVTALVFIAVARRTDEKPQADDPS